MSEENTFRTKEERQQLRIKLIEEIRKDNNIQWMNILRIAMAKDPRTTAKILRSITNNDRRINSITKEMCDEELS